MAGTEGGVTPSNKGLHQTKRQGVPASRAVVEGRFAGEPRCYAHRSWLKGEVIDALS